MRKALTTAFKKSLMDDGMSESEADAEVRRRERNGLRLGEYLSSI
jgi:hypothetical protein